MNIHFLKKLYICVNNQVTKSRYNDQLTNLNIYFCHRCHNPKLRLVTKARACKGAGQEESLGVTPHAHGSVRECEGMNTHTPK
jgi:hypothetical protein